MTESVLNDGEIKYCEGEITEKECLDNLKAMPNGKALGTSFKTGRMSISQRRGVITLITRNNAIPFF